MPVKGYFSNPQYPDIDLKRLVRNCTVPQVQICTHLH